MAKQKTTPKKAAAKATTDTAGFRIPSPPKRSRIDEPKAEAFVGSQPSLRRDGQPAERLTVYMPPPLIEALRVRCARERRSLSDAVTEAVSEWINR